MPQDFETFWQDYGDIIPTDLNADGDTDYLLSVNFLLGGESSNYGIFFWLYFKNGQGILERLSQFDDKWNSFLYPRNISIQNLMGDELPEITFTVGDCGASTCFLSLRILSLKDGHFTNVFTVPWYTMNGTWTVKRDESGQVAAIGTYNGPGIAGFGDFLSYALHFRYRDGKFMLVEQEPINNFPRPFLYWQLGSLKLHQYQFDEALAIFKDLAADEPPSHGINYPVYAMFRVGMIYLVLEQPDETRKVWAELIEKYPQEPVSADAYSMLQYWHGDLTVGTVCRFLPKMITDWGTSDEARAAPDFERGVYLSTTDVCSDIFLLPLQKWENSDTIARQMSDLWLQWQFLSDEFDFNGDGTADIVGVIVHSGNEGRSPWVFLSGQDGYQPVLVQNPFPIGSIYIWQRGMYDYMYTPIPFDVDIRLKDFDRDGVPEFYAGRYGTYHWMGDGFQPSENEATVDSQSVKLNRAIELLFFNQNPANAITVLDNYNPPFGAEKQMKVLLQGLAWQYLGDQKQADKFFQKFVASYPASGWISFVNEVKDREVLPQ